MRKYWRICYTLIILFCFSVLLFPANSVRIKSIDFGKYDENAFSIYERTNIIPKKSKLIAAVSVHIFERARIKYEFVMKLPESVKYLLVYDKGEWKRLRQGDQHSTANPHKTMTHILEKDMYYIEGRYQTGLKGGYIRGIYKCETLPIGKYTVDVYINGQHLKKVRFKVVDPFSEETENKKSK